MPALYLTVLLLAADPTPPEGVLPKSDNGVSLNFDFETGTLKDWTAEGDAFQGQPIEGDTVFPRRQDMKSQHQGRFWIGGYERRGDKPQGTLTSVPFTVTHPWASFLVAGGPHTLETCVELLLADTKQVFYRTSGDESENLKRVAVDLRQQLGQRIQIRLVDRHSGHWGHINFDDFRFHGSKPNAPERIIPTPDVYAFAGQPPQQAAKNMIVPKGFKVQLFAAEPDVHQPIAMCTDDRGRVWVIEAFTYPRRHPEPGPILSDKRLGDKILILEDTDGDGRHDKRTVFLEGLNLASGIEYGFGGLWVGAAPYFLFIPILEGDKPGEPRILLDGWGFQDTHETLNSFLWGPDGWLYGCHGVFTHSRVGKPGTPDAERIPINAGIWRYHPTKHRFEVVAHGTSNPWGLDYNATGDWFIEACVIPHLWHIVPGGRYQRQAGQHFNPFTFTEIGTIAKHRHYVGATPHGGNGRSDSVGGGHAHSGLLCYQSGLWPQEYHGKLFMGNIHGHRVNVDVVSPKGASYEGDRNPDFLLTQDRHCIIVALHAAPDGNVYFTDWSDKQVCHRNEPEIWDRTNGRIFKIVHESTKPWKNQDLQALSTGELLKLVTSNNEWLSRHARRILHERQSRVQPEDITSLEERLQTASTTGERLQTATTTGERLRLLWTLHLLHEHGWPKVASLMRDRDPHLRAWAITLAFEDGAPRWMSEQELVDHLRDTEVSPVVRRAVASALLQHRYLQPLAARLLPHLLKHAADNTDPVLPHLLWYLLEPICGAQPAEGLKLAAEARITHLLPQAARRVGAMADPPAISALMTRLKHASESIQQVAYLRGLQEAAKGKRNQTAPPGWGQIVGQLLASPDAEVRQITLALSVAYGDAVAFDTLRTHLVDRAKPQGERLAALNALLAAKDAKLPETLQQLLSDAALRSAAIRALASYDNPLTPKLLRDHYKQFTAAEKRDALTTLASRTSYAVQLLDAMERREIPSSDVPAELVRQMRILQDPKIAARVIELWGSVRDTPAERQKLIREWQAKLKQPFAADLSAGRTVFNKVCAQCHMLYGVGGKVGPEITGANRSDLNYLLENIFDPSAVIPKEYAATKIDLEDGRVITGIIKEEQANTLTVMTANETLTLSKQDVVKRTPSPLSMMPDDLTKPLSEAEVKHLIAYLRHPEQVPLKATEENVKDFFNGKDLTGWDADATATELKVWSVRNGEIVGQTSTGLKRNTFLTSQLEVSDFRLSLKVKLVPNDANSGIQFRSVRIEGGEMRGPQADIGKGWWGKLYEESARGLLVKNDNDALVKVNDWNEYIIEAQGSTVKMFLNGKQVVDLTDEKLAKKGLIGLQVHSGGPMEVRFKDLKLEVLK